MPNYVIVSKKLERTTRPRLVSVGILTVDNKDRNLQDANTHSGEGYFLLKWKLDSTKFSPGGVRLYIISVEC